MGGQRGQMDGRKEAGCLLVLWLLLLVFVSPPRCQLGGWFCSGPHSLLNFPLIAFSPPSQTSASATSVQGYQLLSPFSKTVLFCPFFLSFIEVVVRTPALLA